MHCLTKPGKGKESINIRENDLQIYMGKLEMNSNDLTREKRGNSDINKYHK